MIRRRLLLRAQIALLIVTAIPAFAKTNTKVVVVPVANMYSRPTDKSDVVSQAIYGSNVILLQARGEWSRIQTSDRYKGWTPSRYLRILLIGDGYATVEPTVQVESLFANIYSEPDVTKHKPVVTIPFESKLELIPEDTSKPNKQHHEGWLQVRLPTLTTAWIQTSDVEADPKPLSIPESIELAKRFLGLPYLWGGRSSFGFDCSGFAPDAGAGQGNQHATRCGSAGSLERRVGNRPQRSASGRSALFWFVGQGHHAHGDVHRRRTVYPRHNQWASGRADQQTR